LFPAATLARYGMKEIQRLGKNLHTTLALADACPTSWNMATGG
jgi:hypothetical protein